MHSQPATPNSTQPVLINISSVTDTAKRSRVPSSTGVEVKYVRSNIAKLRRGYYSTCKLHAGAVGFGTSWEGQA